MMSALHLMFNSVVAAFLFLWYHRCVTGHFITTLTKVVLTFSWYHQGVRPPTGKSATLAIISPKDSDEDRTAEINSDKNNKPRREMD